MGIPIGQQQQQSRVPTVKLRTPTSKVGLAIVNEETVPWLEFGTDRPRLNAKGEPRTQLVLTGIVTGSTGAAVITTTTPDGVQTDEPVAPGMVVRLFVNGRTRWDPDLDRTRNPGDPKSWGGAKDDHGQLMAGDIATVIYEADVQGQGAQPRKVRTFRLRSPRPDEQEQTTRCEAVYGELTRIHLGSSSSTAAAEGLEPF